MSTDFPQPRPLSRRRLLQHAGAGFGAVALADLLGRDVLGAATAPANPLAARAPHFAPRAKAIIHLFMHGGPSHLDTFDPKPSLARFDNQPPPAEFHKLQLQFTDVSKQKLMASKMTFSRCGQSGIEICNALPNVQKIADDLCVIRSAHHEVFNHTPGIWMHNTGSAFPGRPSMGAWLGYGLGSVAENMPAFVVMNSRPIKPGPGVWGNGFLPAIYQGTVVTPGPVPIAHLAPPAALHGVDRRPAMDYLQSLNRAHDAMRHDEELESRISSYELAFQMQTAAPEAVDIANESKKVRELYGPTFGEQCLIARRLVERGVRYVQIYHGGAGGDWDTHSNNLNGQVSMLREVDRGCAALVQDLKSRGMLDETLVIWTGEFGRTPTTEGSNGRDHSPYGYSLWLAGAGVRAGTVIGETDDFGFRAAKDPVHLHDLNATYLHLMGLDHHRLTYRYAGRDFRLTDVHGNVVKAITG